MIEWNSFVEKISEYAGMEKDEIKKETNIYSDLGMDSLGLFSLGMFLINSFSITIPLSSVASIETIGDIFNLLNESASA